MIAFLVAATIAGQAATTRDWVQEQHDAELGWSKALIHLDVDGAFGSPADSFNFYTTWDRPRGGPGSNTEPGASEPRRYFAIRRASRTETAPVWASSLNCPAVEPLMAALEEVDPPRIDVWGVGEDRMPSMVLDGVSYRLSVEYPVWPQATGYRMTLGGNVNSPLAGWARSLYRDLESCWSSEPPPAAGSSRG